MRIISFLAGSALLAVSTAASAAPSAPAPANRAASLSVARASSAAPKASRIGSDVGTSTLLNIGILAALTAGVLVLTSDDDDDSDSN